MFQYTTQITNLIRIYTRLQHLELVPEIRLFLQEHIDISDCVRQETGERVDVTGWATVWAGGLALSRYVLDNPTSVKDKVICDFCSGSGIVGIAAKLAGASEVICVDNEPISHIAIDLNARANGVEVKVQSTLQHCDVILTGDPWFSRRVDLFDMIPDDVTTIIGRPQRTPTLHEQYKQINSYFVKTIEYPLGRDIFIYKN
jgi:predicted nicotinamide N-methyase